MGIKADKRYNGTVRSGGGLIETGTGSIGYQIPLECEDGDTEFVVWLTPKNLERARKTFLETFHIKEADLENANYVENFLGQQIEGSEVSFGTKLDEYKGLSRVKVAWIGKKSESLAEGGLGEAAAKFFAMKPELKAKAAGKKKQRPNPNETTEIQDDDF